jgi:catechol 2,3-dioxygenase-like lactoylglutathione lyase family enzyme
MKRSVFVIAILACIVAFASDPPKRPRIFGIAQVQISADHLPASRDFYENVLKVTRPTNCNWCEKMPSQILSVNGLQVISLSPASSTNRIAEIAFATDDIPALRRYLTFYKMEVSKPQAPVDNYLMVTDPEGHHIAFVLRPKNHSKFGAARGPLPSLGPDLIHAGFVVHDRAAEDRFYKDVLGFRLYWQGGMKDDQTDWVDMQVPDGTDWIEYMLNVSPNAGKKLLGIMNHFALGVPDVHAAHKQLLENGMRLTEEPKIGRDGKWQLNLYDPDDTRVELMEFKPVQEPCCSEFTGPHPGPKQ